MAHRNTIHDILTQREEFVVIGLTGRMGSGCSKVANVLATPFEKMRFPHPVPQFGMNSLSEEERVVRIVAEYADEHWLKFDIIQVSAIIATFILNDDSCFINDLKRSERTDKPSDSQKDFREGLLKDFDRQLLELGKNCGILAQYKKDGVSNTKLLDIDCEAALKQELNDLGRKLSILVPDGANISSYFSDSNEYSFCNVLFSSKPPQEKWEQIGKTMNCLYRQVLQDYEHIHRRKYLECVDKLLVLFSFYCLWAMQKEVYASDQPANKLWELMQTINKRIEPNAQQSKSQNEQHMQITQIQKFVFVKYITLWLGQAVRQYITEVLGHDAYARLFQRYGQMIRFYGCIPKCDQAGKLKDTRTATSAATDLTGVSDEIEEEKKDIFAIPRKINEHIKVLRHPFREKDHRPVRIVIDSIKNIFEAVYLRYRYSAFYLWAITTDLTIREQRLHDKHLTDIQIRMMDWNEYPDKGREVIAEVNKILDSKNLHYDNPDERNDAYGALKEKIKPEKRGFYLDSTEDKQHEQDTLTDTFCKERREFFRNNTYPFYTQDIDSCVCNADVYLFNNAENATDADNNRKLLETVVRNVCLVMYPCLVRPTPVERCMQIAFSAKVNSGCLSRQVGAVVTDAQYNILAIGWNDVPCGEVSCAYKNLNDLIALADRDAYSEYELSEPGFRKRLATYEIAQDALRGLPCSYCFKNVHKKAKDPMRSRAMHAEEKALALCGREAEGGFLFTTSSPCEMCSKNAKNHKIKKIYYLEAYPGISQAQYTNSGDKNNRAELILFSGAVGRAYMQMYTPLLPHKDVLEYLGAYKSTE